MKRLKETSQEHLARIQEENASFNDWIGICRKCKKQRVGTIADFLKPCGCDVPVQEIRPD